MKYPKPNEIPVEEIMEKLGATGYDAKEIMCKHFSDDGQPWELILIDEDTEYEGHMYRVVAIEKWVYDADDTEAIDYTEEVFVDIQYLNAVGE